MADHSDWSGVANGDQFTITQKRAARTTDLPEYVERVFRRDFNGQDAPAFIQAWRDGLLDVHLSEGKGYAMMTKTQAACWRAAML